MGTPGELLPETRKFYEKELGPHSPAQGFSWSCRWEGPSQSAHEVQEDGSLEKAMSPGVWVVGTRGGVPTYGLQGGEGRKPAEEGRQQRKGAQGTPGRVFSRAAPAPGLCPEASCGTTGFLACLVAQSCLTLCDTWAVAPQAPLSMRFFRQEYWAQWENLRAPGGGWGSEIGIITTARESPGHSPGSELRRQGLLCRPWEPRACPRSPLSPSRLWRNQQERGRGYEVTWRQ